MDVTVVDVMEAAAGRTHQVVTGATRPRPDVVPDHEQRQEEGQHVDLPVPDRQHKYLQAEGPRGSHINERIKQTALQEVSLIFSSSWKLSS